MDGEMILLSHKMMNNGSLLTECMDELTLYLVLLLLYCSQALHLHDP